MAFIFLWLCAVWKAIIFQRLKNTRNLLAFCICPSRPRARKQRISGYISCISKSTKKRSLATHFSINQMKRSISVLPFIEKKHFFALLLWWFFFLNFSYLSPSFLPSNKRREIAVPTWPINLPRIDMQFTENPGHFLFQRDQVHSGFWGKKSTDSKLKHFEGKSQSDKLDCTV